MTETSDVFICHASEDKESFVRPLAEALRMLGVSVWYDEFSLEPGDSLSGGIDRGIAGCKFGVVVISKAFVAKAWPQHELRGLVCRDVEEDLRLIPIWHGVTKDEVRDFSPSLSDKVALDTRRENAQDASIKLLRIVRPDLYQAHPREELKNLVSGQAIRALQCHIEKLREVIERKTRDLDKKTELLESRTRYRFTETDEITVLDQLKMAPTATVRMFCTAYDPEVAYFRAKLITVLQNANWVVEKDVLDLSSSLEPGVRMFASGDTPSASVSALYVALKKCEESLDLYRDPKLPDGVIGIQIGSKKPQ